MRVVKKDCEELIMKLVAAGAFDDAARKETRPGEPRRIIDIKENDARVGGYKIRAVNSRGGYTTLFSGTLREVHAWLNGIDWILRRARTRSMA